MSDCSFSRLLQFLNKQLDLDGQLEVYDHLDRCDICRDAVYQLSHDRDSALFVYRAYRFEPFNLRHHTDEAARSFAFDTGRSQTLLHARRQA